MVTHLKLEYLMERANDALERAEQAHKYALEANEKALAFLARSEKNRPVGRKGE